MRRFSLKAALLAGSALVFAASWTPASAQTIDDALTAAYRTNPQLLAQRAALRALDEGVPQALSSWRPTVTLSGSLGKARDTTRTTNTVTENTSIVERYRTPDLASLSLTQPLYRGGRTLASTSQAENRVQQGRANLHSVEQAVLLQAATDYANLLRDQATLELNTNNEQRLGRELEATRDRFQVGEVTRTDVSQAEARLAQARAARTTADGNLISTRAAYERDIGSLPPARLAPTRLPQNLPQSEAEARSGAANHPDFIAARFAEKASADAIDVVLGEKLPTVSLTGSIARNTENQTRGVQQDTGSVALTVSVPLYQAGEPDARARVAKQQHGQQRLTVDLQRRSTIETAVRAWDGLAIARGQIESFQAQIRSAEVALEGVQQEARVGLRTVLDVLNAEQELFQARVSLVTSQRDEAVFAYTLLAATGRLTAGDLGLPVDIYDPTRYYNETRGRWFGTGISSEDQPRPGSAANQ